MHLKDHKFWIIQSNILTLSLSVFFANYGTIEKKDTFCISDANNNKKKIILYSEAHSIISDRDEQEYYAFLKDLSQQGSQGSTHVLIEQVLDFYNRATYKKITHDALTVIDEMQNISSEDIENRHHANIAYFIARSEKRPSSLLRYTIAGESYLLPSLTFKKINTEFLDMMHHIANVIDQSCEYTNIEDWIMEKCEDAWKCRQRWTCWLESDLVSIDDPILTFIDSCNSDEKLNFKQNVLHSFKHLFDLHAFERFMDAHKNANNHCIIVVAGGSHIEVLRKALSILFHIK